MYCMDSCQSEGGRPELDDDDDDNDDDNNKAFSFINAVAPQRIDKLQHKHKINHNLHK